MTKFLRSVSIVFLVALIGCPPPQNTGQATLRVTNDTDALSVAGMFAVASGALPIATNPIATPFGPGESFDFPLVVSGPWSVEIWLDTTGSTDYTPPLSRDGFNSLDDMLVWSSGIYGDDVPVDVPSNSIVTLTVTGEDGVYTVERSVDPR